jgi:hypothetical protein
MLIVLDCEENTNQNIEISLHSSQNGCHQENKLQQLLVRMQRNRSNFTPLVGIQVSTTTTESFMEIPHKTRNN